MSWLNVDDQFAFHPKLVRIGPYGLALQVRALCYCAQYLTDGFLPLSPALAFCADLPGTAQQWCQTMVDNKLWQLTDGGFLVHDYLVYNRSKHQIETARKMKARGGRNSQINQHPERYPQRSVQASPLASAKDHLQVSPLPLPLKKEKLLINPTSTPKSVSHVSDRITKGFELSTDGLSGLIKSIADKQSS